MKAISPAVYAMIALLALFGAASLGVMAANPDLRLHVRSLLWGER